MKPRRDIFLLGVAMVLLLGAGCAGPRAVKGGGGGEDGDARRLVDEILAEFPARYREALRSAAPLHRELHSLLADRHFELAERKLLIRVYRRHPELRFVDESGPRPLVVALDRLLASAEEHGFVAGRFETPGRKSLLNACLGALEGARGGAVPRASWRSWLLRRARTLAATEPDAERMGRRLLFELLRVGGPDPALRAAFARQRRGREVASRPCAKLELRLMDELARFARALGHGAGDDGRLALSLDKVRDARDLQEQADSWSPTHPQYARLRRALARRRAGGITSREARVIALNLARMRVGHAWRAADALLVNIPGFEAELRLGGKEVARYRVVVGGARKMRCDERRRVMVLAHATPSLDSRIEELVLAPYWVVTERIRQVEFEAEQAKDPVYFEKHGYELLGDGTEHEKLRQLPGRHNALGFVKFVFPNAGRIFLHDTPEQGLFARETRAASHGCVRVQGAWSLARRILMRDGSGTRRYGRLRARWAKNDFSQLRRRWDRERYESLRARAMDLETRVKLKRPLAVATTYLTARADAAGRVSFLADLYGKDAEALGERKVRRCTPESQLAVRAFAKMPALVLDAQRGLTLHAACLARSSSVGKAGSSARRRRALSGLRAEAENLARRILEGHRQLRADLAMGGGRWRWRLIKRAMGLQHLVKALTRQLKHAERVCGSRSR